MTTKLRAEGMNFKGVPSVIVVMGLWDMNGIDHIIGVFGGEDRVEKANASIKEALTADDPRYSAWIKGDFFVQ